ncbi:hypothetical protein [Fulvimarina sp. MAC3]|uniref:hypothetical protein n=1 Tax=Fulvimarina sp. MAC3 TaxID=3148887 RepID=UPI0031FD5905
MTPRSSLLTCGLLLLTTGLISPAVANGQNLPAADSEISIDGAAADGPAPYLDDRSTPVSLITSLYNAIDRQEYLRAWSYFSEESGRPGFTKFEEGYETTGGVKLKLGDTISDGAAGSIYTSVPTVIEATGTDGSVRVFSGCYVTRFVEPANQATPPFVPLQISRAKLRPAHTKFDETSGDCPGGGE